MLNATAAFLLAAGYRAIRRRDIAAHRQRMLAASAVSVLFLVCYCVYHATMQARTGSGHARFSGTGPIRAVYLGILLSHVVLAAVNLPMVVVTLHCAWRCRFEQHARLARWTLPVWVYVSVTGVMVYLMLYHLFPGRP